jgi:hypothetical protein
MRYLLLLMDDEERVDSMADAERRAIVDEHIAYSRRLRDAGAYAGGEALGSSAETRVLRRDGERAIVTDGPFAETKEQLGGFYVIECGGIDDALRWAEQVPKSPGLVVEIRPIAEV